MEGNSHPFRPSKEEHLPEYADSEGESEPQQQSADIIENADMEFVVEGRVLKANRGCLCMMSSVFKVMLKGCFKENRQSRIPLPGKTYPQMLEFIEVTHAGKSIDDENVEMVLKLANEYDCKPLLPRCEDVLSKRVPTFDLLYLASEYNLCQLQEDCLGSLLSQDFNSIASTNYHRLGSETKVKYLERKLDDVEGQLMELKKGEEKVKKIEEISSTPLANVICCNETLKDFKSSRKPVIWPKFEGNLTHIQNAGRHIAASQPHLCDICRDFKYWAIEKTLHPVPERRLYTLNFSTLQ